MDNQRKTAKVTYLHSTKNEKEACAQTDIVRYKAIQIALHCERFEACIARQWSITDLLIQEIDLWAKYLGPRTIESIHIYNPTAYLEPYELTRIMHAISSHFHFSGGGNKHHVVVSPPEQINKDTLALLRGLGFNQCRLLLNAQPQKTLHVLIEKVNAVRELNFTYVGIQLSHTIDPNSIRELTYTLCQSCNPDYICVGNENNAFNVFTREHHPYEKENNDTLELGPESCSILGDNEFVGFKDPDRYFTAITNRKIPTHQR